ncbi:MAG: hypothetical protein RID91_14605 [Azospirillaceae bacterium]
MPREAGAPWLGGPTGAADIVAVTGQSLARGRARAITREPVDPRRAFRLTGGPVAEGPQAVSGPLVPLAETVVESIASGFAGQLLSNDRRRSVIVVGQAAGGQPYAAVRKGAVTGVHERTVSQVGAAAGLASARARAVLVLHGETDGVLGNAAYDRDLLEWLGAFEADLAPFLADGERLALLICQTSSVSGYARGRRSRDAFVTPFLQCAAARANLRILLVGPKYQYDYLDPAHLDAASTRAHGELFAKVYAEAVIGGAAWRPMGPDRVTVAGHRIVIDFHVPISPLVIDDTTIADPGHAGFCLVDAGTCRIADVAVTGPSQVTVGLSHDPPAGARLSYAFHNGEDGHSGRRYGARGCLRDSDPTPSATTGAALRNWCVAFEHRIDE